MRIDEQVLLGVRIELEKLVTEREGMIAENQQRSCSSYSPAYGENGFFNITKEMEILRERLNLLGK